VCACVHACEKTLRQKFCGSNRVELLTGQTRICKNICNEMCLDRCVYQQTKIWGLIKALEGNLKTQDRRRHYKRL